MENDRPPDLSEEALKEIESHLTKDWIRGTNRRSYEAWELARGLEKEGIKTGEWWKELWRWKEDVDKALEEFDDMKTQQAVTATEMRNQVRLWSFVGSVSGGVIVGVILWVLKGP